MVFSSYDSIETYNYIVEEVIVIVEVQQRLFDSMAPTFINKRVSLPRKRSDFSLESFIETFG